MSSDPDRFSLEFCCKSLGEAKVSVHGFIPHTLPILHNGFFSFRNKEKKIHFQASPAL